MQTHELQLDRLVVMVQPRALARPVFPTLIGGSTSAVLKLHGIPPWRQAEELGAGRRVSMRNTARHRASGRVMRPAVDLEKRK